MTAYLKVGGAWRTITGPKVKIGGAWKTASAGWIKRAGVWRKVWPISGQVGNSGSTINTNAGAKAVAMAGLAGSYLFALVAVTNQHANNGTITDNKGGTWGPLIEANNSAPNRSVGIWARNEPCTDGTQVTVTWTPGTAGSTADGGGFTLIRVDGFGAYTVPQMKAVNDQASGVPTVTMDNNFDSSSLLLGITISTDRAPAAPTGWTNQFQSSYFTPQTYISTSTRDFGQTGNQIAWGILNASNWCACVAEIKP